MSLILRNVKGSALTHAEMDDNLTYLEDLTDTAGEGKFLPLSGGTMTGDINMTGGTSLTSSNGDCKIDLRGYNTDDQMIITTDNGGGIEITNDNGYWSKSVVNLTDSQLGLMNLRPNGKVYISTDSTGSIQNISNKTTIQTTFSNAEIYIENNTSSNINSPNNDNKGIMIGSRNSTVNLGVVNSVILGGNSITATESNTVYVPKLVGTNIPAFADEAAAVAGGLVSGAFYQTDGTGASPLNVAGILMIKQ